MKFNKGDRVYSKIINKEGEVLYTSVSNMYLIGIKDYKEYNTVPFLEDLQLEINEKGYTDHCFWFSEDELELVKKGK